MSKNSKKKLKWLIPIAVLSATCLSAGMLAGCGGNGEDDQTGDHTHAYEWKYEGDEHWKECPEDGAEEEGTRGPHDFVDGECECGATEAPKTYGKVTGKITLRKLGGTDTDFSGVNIDMGDEVEPVFDAEAGTFTIENVEVGKSYSLTVSKPGYLNYAVTVQVSEENETVKIGGERGIVLEYKAFDFFMGWDGDLHDMSHVNDAENTYIMHKAAEKGKSLDVITNESYEDVAVTFDVKRNNSLHDWHLQGLAFKFDDGKHVIVRYHGGNHCIQIGTAQWGDQELGLKETDSLFGDDVGLNQWGEKGIYDIADNDTKLNSEEGVSMTAVLKDGKLTVVVDGVWCYSYQLPAEYAEKKAKVLFYSYDPAQNAIFSYKITEQLPAMEAALNLDVTQPENAGCAVTATPAKDKYAFGEEVELTVTPASGYKLDALTVNGKDMYNSLQEGKLTVIADRATVEVKAKFSEKVEAPLNLTVKGKKLGTTANLAKDTEVTLSGIATPFTVNADGKITADSITFGRYTVTVAGYISQEINLTDELTEIVLEYDAFGIVRWDGAGHDLSHVNDDEPYIQFNGPGSSMNVISKEKLSGDFSVSVVLKAGTSTDGDRQQGVILQFEDGKAAILNINIAGTPRLQFRPELFSENNDPSVGLRTVFTQEWVEFRNVTAEEVAKYNSEEGVELTLERRGASLFTYLDGVFHGKADLPEGYADDKAGFGFFAFGAVANSKWYFEVSEALGSVGVTVTDGTAKDANGSIEISPAEINMGDTVTITVTPAADYVLDTLTVSGGVTATKQENGTYTFVASLSEHTVTATFKSAIVTVNNGTATGANGKVEYTTDKILFGDTVTITVTPDEGYILSTLTVVDGDSNSVALTKNDDGTYTFVATVNTYTVTGTFVEEPEQPAEATVSGIGLGNTPISFEGKKITLTPEEGTAVNLTVTDGKISQVLAPGKYTLSVDGYYDVKVTVGADGTFEGLTEGAIKFEKIIFEHDGIGESQSNLDENGFLGIVADSTKAASTGVISVDKKGSIYEWTVDEYKDVAISFTLQKKVKEQGIMMLVAHQKVISVRFQDNGGKPKMQWLGDWYGGWFWGTQSAIETFDFGNGEDYLNPLSADLLEKYSSNEGLKVTLLRKDSMLYVLVDGKIYTSHILGQYASSNVKFGLYVQDTEKAYNIPFEIDTDVDAILNNLSQNGALKVVNTSNVTVTENTVAVTGSGYVEVAPTSKATVEYLSIKIAQDKATKQGLTYRFADGKWVGFRYEPSYIQYTQDLTISGNAGGRLKGWYTIHDFTDSEKDSFADAKEGLDLALLRNGKYLYVMLGGNIIDTIVLDDAHATMDGVAAINVEGGTGTAFAYEHKVGDEAIPAGYYTASVSTTFPTEKPNNYDVSLDKQLVKSGESVTLTIKTNASWWNAWSYFPTSVKVNGEEKFVSSDMVSNSANHLTYTLTIDNVTANTAIEVVIAKGTTIENGVVVTVKDNVGGTAVSDSGANGYYWNDGCDIYMTPAEGYEIESITVDDGTPVTSGWTFNSEHNRYVYSLPNPIHEPVTVVVAFKAAQTTPVTTPVINSEKSLIAPQGADTRNFDAEGNDFVYYEIYGGDETVTKSGKNDLVTSETVTSGTKATDFPAGMTGGSAQDSKTCYTIAADGSVELTVTVIKGLTQVQVYVASLEDGAEFTAEIKVGEESKTLTATTQAADGAKNVKIVLDTSAFADDETRTMTVKITCNKAFKCASVGIRANDASVNDVVAG